VIVTLATDLLIGVGFGILLKFIFTLVYGKSFKSLFKANVEIKSEGNDINVIIHDSLVFSNLLGFKKYLNLIPNGKNVVIDVSKAQMVDHTSIIAMNGFVADYKENGGKIVVIGFQNHKQLGHAPTSARVIKMA
jgi:MFS superfamily sulfate permease-like transporter